MDSREELEKLLNELTEQHAEFVLAQHHLAAAGGLETELQDKMRSAVEFEDEAWYNIVSMFDREHDRVMALSRWLRDATQMLSEVTASIDYRMSGEK